MWIPRCAPIAFLAILVLTAACGSAADPPADTAAMDATIEAEVEPTPEATPAPTPEATPDPTPEPTPSAQTAENCMDPDTHELLVTGEDWTEDERRTLIAALESYDFSDEEDPEARERYERWVENFIGILEGDLRGDPRSYLLPVLTGEVPIIACES